MGDTSDQIERHIQEKRDDLSDNFNELKEKVRTAVDWRAQFEERPMTMLGLAFGGGIVLSALLPSRRSSRRESTVSSPNTRSDRHTSDIPFRANYEYSRNAGAPVETWDAVKGALVGVATSKLSGFIKDLLPGFTEEFIKARNGKYSDRSDRRNPGEPTRQKSTVGVD